MSLVPGQALQHRRLIRASALVAATAATLALILGPGAGVALARKGQTTKLHKGLTLTRYTYPGPNRVRVLTISNPKKSGVSLAVGSASQSWPGMRTPSAIARSYHALATVNGDFSTNGRPVHVSAEDGVLRSDGLATGVGFSISGNDIRAYARRPEMKVTGRTNNPDVPKFDVDKWNSEFGGHRLAGYTTVGGKVAKPPGNVCSAKLDPTSKLKWSPLEAGVTRTYVVSRQEEPCPNNAPTISDPGSVLLAAARDTPKGNMIKALGQNDEVTLTWSAGWKGALDLIGGSPQLLTDRDNNGHPRNVAPAHCGSYFCLRNPRTGVGINRDCVLGRPGCKVFLVTVDGRRSGWSTGMTLPAFANVFKNLGATYAINLDGGGGTDMWTARHGKWCLHSASGGCLVNKPSDPGGERPATEALMVVTGKEARPPTKATSALAFGSESGGALLPFTMPNPAADQAALLDPGSTGGLFDAIESGGLGGGSVPLEVQQGAQVFRAAHGRS